MARRHWLDFVIFPLRWVERAHGWRRVALLVVYVVLGVTGVLGLTRQASLRQIPDCPEPVDEAKDGFVTIPPAEDAVPLYAEAAGLLKTDGQNLALIGQMGQLGPVPSWEKATPEEQAWVRANGPALDRWLAATRRPDAVFAQPAGDGPAATRLDFLKVQPLPRLALLEADRRQAAGDLAGAWPSHLGVIRMATHLKRHSPSYPALMGDQLFRQGITAVRGWLNAEAQTSELIRPALRDLVLARSLFPSAADLIRHDYFSARRDVRQAAGRSAARHQGSPDSVEGALLGRFAAWCGDLVSDEPERSLRLARLITAGHLAQLDRPVADRPAVVDQQFLIYAIDDHTPAPLTRIKPEVLARLAANSACRDHLTLSNFGRSWSMANGQQFDALILQVAEQAYRLDHGDAAPKTYADLMPAYLTTLPEGIKPGDFLVAP